MQQDRKPYGKLKKLYSPPKLTKYGDLKQLTRGTAGPGRDGGRGSAKSKPNGPS